MTQQLTITNASTNTIDIKQISTVRDKRNTKNGWALKSLVTKFWNYTEVAGKTDTTSFKGIL